MRERDQYLKVVQWSEEDQCYVGTCPGFVLGGVHGDDEVEVYRELCDVVDGWIQTFHEDEEPLPAPTAAPEPAETEAWLLSGRPTPASMPVNPRLYQVLDDQPTGDEVAEPRAPYGDEIDEPRAELASLIEEAVLPWTRIAGWTDSEEIRFEVERRILRHLKAAHYSREVAASLVPKIVGLLSD